MQAYCGSDCLPAPPPYAHTHTANSIICKQRHHRHAGAWRTRSSAGAAAVCMHVHGEPDHLRVLLRRRTANRIIGRSHRRMHAGTLRTRPSAGATAICTQVHCKPDHLQAPPADARRCTASAIMCGHRLPYARRRTANPIICVRCRCMDAAALETRSCAGANTGGTQARCEPEYLQAPPSYAHGRTANPITCECCDTGALRTR